MNIINVENIGLLRQGTQIIRNFSLKVSTGEKINIFGKNGSGKTSLIKILAGITTPSTGNVSVNADLVFNKDIFYIGHKYGLKNELNVYDNLNYIMNLNQVNRKINLENELSFYKINTSSKSVVKYLSHGQKKIISLIGLTLTNNKLWILDEPFTGLDQDVVGKFIYKINAHIQKSGSVIITSHKEKEGFKNIELC